MNGAGTRTIRLLLADDRSAVRKGLKIWLSLEPDLEVVGEASDGAEAITVARALRPDVVLMDVEMCRAWTGSRPPPRCARPPRRVR